MNRRQRARLSEPLCRPRRFPTRPAGTSESELIKRGAILKTQTRAPFCMLGCLHAELERESFREKKEKKERERRTPSSARIASSVAQLYVYVCLHKHPYVRTHICMHAVSISVGCRCEMTESQVLFLTLVQDVGQPPARGRRPRQPSAYKVFNWFSTNLTRVRLGDLEPLTPSFLHLFSSQRKCRKGKS